MKKFEFVFSQKSEFATTNLEKRIWQIFDDASTTKIIICDDNDVSADCEIFIYCFVVLVSGTERIS